MKRFLIAVILISNLHYHSSWGQETQSVVEDFKLSSVNQPGKEFPQVNSQGRVRASILSPNANKVQLDIGGVKYGMIKNTAGVWTGESAPQDEGFHYY